MARAYRVGRTLTAIGEVIMELEIKRHNSTDQSTAGELYINGVFACYTLEDVVRPEKIPGQTAIPSGKYRVEVNWSNRFQKFMPILLNVPNFTGVRIHSGNTAADTEGCILVGLARAVETPNFLGDSRRAYDQVFPQIAAAHDRGEDIFLTIGA